MCLAEELHERIVKKGGVKSLLNLLTHSQDAEAQRFSALAIANCASAVFNRLPIVAEGTLQPLVDYIKDESSDLIGRQYCAMGIGNLAAEPENHEEIVKLDGIDALMSLLKTEDVESGRYSAFALSNLAANANHRQQIVDEGGPAALVALACCEDLNAQRQALAALRGLCISPMYRPLVVREGILDPLVLMARTEEIDVLREVRPRALHGAPAGGVTRQKPAQSCSPRPLDPPDDCISCVSDGRMKVAAALNCLSSVEENKGEICDRSISTIIAMLLSGDTEVERHACCTIANLMEMAEQHGRLLEERGLAPLVALALSDDLNTKGEASRAIANLAANADVQQVSWCGTKESRAHPPEPTDL